MKHIFIVEDDPVTANVVSEALKAEGFRISWNREGNAGLLEIRKMLPDLLVLDLMLPGKPGLEICQEIRRDQNLCGLPILILTAKGTETDRVVGLELGADDYLVKPFSTAELAARVKALLRRAEPPIDREERVQAGELALDPATLRVTRSGKAVSVSTPEFRLLYFFITHPNKVFSRDQLLNKVWGPGHFVTPRIVDVYVRKLREKVEQNSSKPIYIKTV